MNEPEAEPPPIHSKPAVKPLGGLTAHILPTSATMVGVCIAVLSMGHLGSAGRVRVLIDKLLAFDALMFLTSAVLSFMSMRMALSSIRLESRAELIFLGGLGVLALATVALAFSIN